MRRKGILAMVLAAGLALQACALSRGLGIEGEKEIDAVYRGGELHATYPAAFDRTWEEALGAVKELGADVAATPESAPVRRIQAKMPDGTPVAITLALVGPDETLASIRVGAKGDEMVFMRVHRAIAERLYRIDAITYADADDYRDFRENLKSRVGIRD